MMGISSLFRLVMCTATIGITMLLLLNVSLSFSVPYITLMYICTSKFNHRVLHMHSLPRGHAFQARGSTGTPLMQTACLRAWRSIVSWTRPPRGGLVHLLDILMPPLGCLPRQLYLSPAWVVDAFCIRWNWVVLYVLLFSPPEAGWHSLAQ